MEHDKSETSFLVALNKVQGLIEPVTKDKTNPHYKSGYASLAAVNETIMGPLAENGFILLSGGVEIGGKPWLRTTLYHVGGHSIHFDYPLLVNDDNPQHLASATTYARRYSLCAFFNLSTEDDDGNAAAVRTVNREPAKAYVPSDSPKTLPAAPANASGGFCRFVPSAVSFVAGKGKGANKTFSKITSPEGVTYDGTEIQGQLAESARAAGKEIVLAFTISQYGAKATHVKLNESQRDPEPKEEVPF
jgi:hypothetical protein